MTESICCVLLFRFSKRESSSLLERKTGSRFSQTIPSRPSPALTGCRRKKLSIAAGVGTLSVGVDFGTFPKGGHPSEKKDRHSILPGRSGNSNPPRLWDPHSPAPSAVKRF